MAIYAQFDENGAQEQVATNTGWSQFGDWADDQDVADYPALVQLWEHGHSTSLKDVHVELGKALQGHTLPYNPEGDLRAIMEGLQKAVGDNLDAEILLVTNGVRADDGSPEESQLAAGETPE